MANTITLEKILTAKQLSMLNALNALDDKGRTLVAFEGKGTARKLCLEAMRDAAYIAAMTTFVAGGCKDIRPFCALVNSWTSQWVDGKDLPAAPTKRQAFLEYAATVGLWAKLAKTEKTRDRRTTVALRVYALVDDITAHINAHYAARDAAKANATEVVITA